MLGLLRRQKWTLAASIFVVSILASSAVGYAAPPPPPVITQPTTGSRVKLLTIAVTIGASPLAGSEQVVFTGSASRTVGLTDMVGANTFTIDPNNVLATAQVTGITGGSTIPDGTYTMTYSYRNAGGQLSSTAVTNITIDTTAPTVTALSPVNASTGVSTSSFGITFNETVTVGSGNFVIKKVSDNTVVETIAANGAQVTGSGTTALTIQSLASFSSGTQYYIAIDSTAVQDLAGNNFAGYGTSADWSFTRAVNSATVPSSPGNSGSSVSSISIATPNGTNITAVNSVAENSLSGQDGDKIYPLGLVDFSFTAPVGSTNQMSLTFVTDLKPSQVTARKYKPSTHTYVDVPGAIVTETTVGGQHALLLSYSITDGGSLDDDGLANGVIVDPIGLASDPGKTELAATGSDITGPALIADLVAGLGVAAVIYMSMRSWRSHRMK